MIRPFIKYYLQWRKDRKKDRDYRIYMSDTLMLICENTARLVGGRYKTNRYWDLISEKKRERPERTAKEIADGIIKGLHS